MFKIMLTMVMPLACFLPNFAHGKAESCCLEMASYLLPKSTHVSVDTVPIPPRAHRLEGEKGFLQVIL